MKKILFLAAICLPLLFTGCEKRKINTDCTISGYIYDAYTSAPLQGVDVTLQPGYYGSRATGSDGLYQFDNVEADIQYTIGAHKRGYQYNKKSIKAQPGRNEHIDIWLEPEK